MEYQPEAIDMGVVMGVDVPAPIINPCKFNRLNHERAA